MNPGPASTTYRIEAADHDARTDVALFGRMARGDERALGELYDRWEPRVRVLAVGIVRDAMDADDVVEEVFWQAWRHADRFDESKGAPGSWLLMVARSRSLDRLRSTRRTRDQDDLKTAEARPGGGTAFIGIEDPSHDAEVEDLGRLVRAEMARLPDEQRGVVELAYFEGLSQTEIADRTGVPLGTIKTRMRLALGKLRDRFARLEDHLT